METPEQIYLIDMGHEIAWCDDPAPDDDIDENDVVKYIRADCTIRPAPCKNQCESQAFNIEIRRLRGVISEVIDSHEILADRDDRMIIKLKKAMAI